MTLHVARENISEDEKKVFLGAADVQHEFDHPNIVKCLGIAMDYEPVIVVMEYMTGMVPIFTVLVPDYKFIFPTFVLMAPFPDRCFHLLY